MCWAGAGSAPHAEGLEEDDVFSARFFLVEGGEGLRRGQEGGALGGRVLRGWAGRLGEEVWKTEVGCGQPPGTAGPCAWVAGSPWGDADLWLLRRMGLRELWLRGACSSLPVSLQKSCCCFRSNEADRGKRVHLGAQPGSPAHGSPHPQLLSTSQDPVSGGPPQTVSPNAVTLQNGRTPQQTPKMPPQ